MKIRFRNSLVRIVTFVIIFLMVFVLPLLVESYRINIIDAVILAIPLSFLISFIFAHFGVGPKLRNSKNKIFLVASLLTYAVIGSMVYILSSKATVIRLILLVPIDVALFIIPLYIFYKSKSETPLDNFEYSQNYTDRLLRLIPSKEVKNHEVYLTDKPIKMSYVETSNGENWKILLKRESILQLNPEELDGVLLESFFARKRGNAMKLVRFIAAYIAVLMDVLLFGSILITIVSPSYDIYIVTMMGASVILIAALPFIVLEFSSFLQSKVDKQVLYNLSRSDSFVSTIRRKSELMIPLRPMTPKQFDRFTKRKERMIEKRIKRIAAFSHGSEKND